MNSSHYIYILWAPVQMVFFHVIPRLNVRILKERHLKET